MEIELHDDVPAKPGEKHGPGGPTHCGSVYVDYEYQVEMWIQEVEKSYPHVVRLLAKDGREWKRDGSGAFVRAQVGAGGG